MSDLSTPLTIICSWGGNIDTAYVTLVEALNYIGSNTMVGVKLNPEIWTAVSSVNQARAILAATRDIDALQDLIGEREFYDQTLEFPRIPSGEERWPWVQRTLTDINTWNIYLREQQRRVKQACAEQAFTKIRDGERDVHTERQLKGIRSFSESYPGLSESYSYGGAVLQLCPEAMVLLKPYRSAGMRLTRG